jgi:hypothetical protein
VVHRAKLRSLASAADRWILTPGINSRLIWHTASHQWLIGHGLDRLTILILFLMEKFWLSIIFFIWRNLDGVWPNFWVIDSSLHIGIGRVVHCAIGCLLYDLLRLGVSNHTGQTIFKLELLQLLLEILGHELEQFNVWFASLGVANASNDSEGIYELVEGEVIVSGCFYFLVIVVLPEFFVFEHDFFQVLKCYDNGVYLAKLAQLKKLNGWDPEAISRKMNENYRY